jgi:hypothetical protein
MAELRAGQVVDGKPAVKKLLGDLRKRHGKAKRA